MNYLQPFPILSRVRVIRGRYEGKTGLLLRYFIDRGRGRAWVRSDVYGTELTFDVDDLVALPESSDQCSEKDAIAHDAANCGSILSDQSSELLSDQCSEKDAIAHDAANCGSILSDQSSELLSDQCSEKDAIAHDAANCGSILSDQSSELLSDQCSEKDAIAHDAAERGAQANADLLAHLNQAIALLHDTDTADGWLDYDRKTSSKAYPRYRWREDGVVRSRALAYSEVQTMRDRLRRGRLLRALLEYLRDE